MHRNIKQMEYNKREKPDISYQPSDKRKFYRLTNPILVRINGVAYKTIDWSISACKIADYTGEMKKNDQTVAEFEINFQGFSVKFEQKIKVLRAEDDEELVIEYIDTCPRNQEIMSLFSKGLITGEFQAFGDFIRHVDIPITDSYLEETFQEDHKSSRFNRVFSVFGYIALGIAVLFYASRLYYANVFLLQINSAVVSGKTEVIEGPSRGILSEIYVEKEQHVEAGTPLFKVLNTRIQGEIERKKNEILKSKAELKEKQTKLWIIRQKINSYKKDISLKLEVQEKEIEAIGEKIDLINAELEQKKKLYEKNIVTQPEIDALKKELIRLNQELTKANYEYFLAYSSYKDPENAVSSININRYNDSKQLEAEIERIKDIIAIEEKELRYIESTNIQNTVKAPFKAFIKEIYAFKGKYVDEKTPIVFLKDVSGEKLIEAYLTEAEALKLRLGLDVKITVPSLNLKFKGTLAKLEKREASPDKNPVVAVINPDNPLLLNEISDGTPAQVVFIKKR